MRIPERKIEVVLESPDGNAKLMFNRLRENTQNKIMQVLKGAKDVADPYTSYEAMTSYYSAILQSCVSVEGLEHEDGALVTVDDIRGLNLYRDIIQLIVGAYFAASEKILSGEASAKNAGTQGA